MRIIGLDLGSKTIGIAISDESGIVATPVETIYYRSNQLEFGLEKLLPILKEKNVGKIVLGLPRNMDGSTGSQGEYSLSFKAMLEEATGLEVILIDERLTSMLVSKVMTSGEASRKQQKSAVDKLAATVILQTYLDQKK